MFSVFCSVIVVGVLIRLLLGVWRNLLTGGDKKKREIKQNFKNGRESIKKTYTEIGLDYDTETGMIYKNGIEMKYDKSTKRFIPSKKPKEYKRNKDP